MQDEQGYLLLEETIALALISIVLCTAAGFLQVVLSVYQIGAESVEGQYFTRSTLQWIQDDLSQAQQIRVGDNGERLYLVRMDGQAVEYYCHRGQLYRHANSTLPITEGIEAIGFTLNSQNYVTIEVRAAGGKAFCVAGGCSIW
ncbi:PulJ/GspJ family protein [Syntrophomonas erecta]